MSIGGFITKDKVYPNSSAAVGVYDAREQARHRRENQWPASQVALVDFATFSTTTSLAIPAAAVAGNTVVVFALAASGDLTAPPAGWTEQSSADNGIVEVTVLVKTLVASDVGSSITIASGGGSLGATATLGSTGGVTPSLAGSSNIGGQAASADIILPATNVANTVVLGAAYSFGSPTFDGDTFDTEITVSSSLTGRFGSKVYTAPMTSSFNVSAPDSGNYNSLSGISLEF